MKDRDDRRNNVGAGQQIRERVVKREATGEKETGEDGEGEARGEQLFTVEWTHSLEMESFSFMQGRAKCRREAEM